MDQGPPQSRRLRRRAHRFRPRQKGSVRAKCHRDWLKSWLQLLVRGNEPLRKCRNGSHAVDASDKDGEKQAEGGHGFGKPQRRMSVVGDTLDSNFGLRTVLGMVACQRSAYAFKTHDLMELGRQLAQAFYEGAPFIPIRTPMFGVPARDAKLVHDQAGAGALRHRAGLPPRVRQDRGSTASGQRQEDSGRRKEGGRLLPRELWTVQ